MVVSLVNLKLKYHNVHDKPIEVCIDLSRSKRIYKAFQLDQNKVKDKEMEINVASLIDKLKEMDIQPHVIKACYLDRMSRNG